MNPNCGCCEGLRPLTPESTANRPGLDALTARVGTHGSFLATMLARLSSSEFPELAGLTTRDSADPAIALLDGWATVADVLTFYSERLANEGYLRTATERRSIVELARLIGYRLRPGVASTVYLAYAIDADRTVTPPRGLETVIPAGSRAQSVPGPGELPQTFETSEALTARSEWNELRPRQSLPQSAYLLASAAAPASLFFQGIATNLKANDALLVDPGLRGVAPQPMRVVAVNPDPKADRTEVLVASWGTIGSRAAAVGAAVEAAPGLKPAALFDALERPASRPPASALQLPRDLAGLTARGSDLFPRLLAAMRPALAPSLYAAIKSAEVTPPAGLRVYAFRVKAPLFGATAPLKLTGIHPKTRAPLTEEWNEADMQSSEELVMDPASDGQAGDLFVAFLDSEYAGIRPDTWVMVDAGATGPDGPGRWHAIGPDPVVAQASDVATVARAAYGVSGKSTRIELGRAHPWLHFGRQGDGEGEGTPMGGDFRFIRRTLVYAQAEELALAAQPITDPVCDGAVTPIELESLYDGLEAGRWLIVSGERTDIPGAAGVKASELVMLAAVTHDVKTIEIPAALASSAGDVTTKPTGKNPVPIPLPGDRTHTFLRLATPLAYCYRRETMVINANVVKATHGETRQEVLGNADGSKSAPTFTLKQTPLTFVSAANPAGVESTLEVRVNDARWHEVDSLAGLGPRDRRFVTRTDDENRTSLTFGTGQVGARPPTGLQNITAVYRTGLGRVGNVKGGQISLLVSRPWGVKDVVNPLPATGGADREGRDLARENAPRALHALDRLVSVLDYADFARGFAGIGKASAARLSDGLREVVHVTVAGADDIPIDVHSDLYRNLVRALRTSGDPFLPVEVSWRQLLLLVISARIKVAIDYQWESVAPAVRVALLDRFGFARRELGQDVAPSEVIAAIQQVRGVDWVDLDLLAAVDETKARAALSASLSPPAAVATLGANLNPASREFQAKLPPPGKVAVELDRPNPAPAPAGPRLLPAQIACLSPDVADTLLLTEITA